MKKYRQRAKFAEAKLQQRAIPVKSGPRDENRELPEPVSRNDYLAQISLFESHVEDLSCSLFKYLKMTLCAVVECVTFLATAMYLDYYGETSQPNNFYEIVYSYLPFFIEAIILRTLTMIIFNNRVQHRLVRDFMSTDRNKLHHLSLSQMTDELEKCKKFGNNINSALNLFKIISMGFILFTILFRLNQFVRKNYQPFHLVNFLSLLESCVQLYRMKTLANRWLELSAEFHHELKKLTDMSEQFTWSFQLPTNNASPCATLTIAKKYKFMNGDIDGKILKRDLFYIFSDLLGLNCYKASYGLIIIGAVRLRAEKYQQAKEWLVNMINKRLTSLHQKQLEKNEAILNEITTTAGLPCWTREETTEDDGLPAINFLLDLPDAVLQAKLLELMKPYFSNMMTEMNIIVVPNSRAFNSLPRLIQAMREWRTLQLSSRASSLPMQEDGREETVRKTSLSPLLLSKETRVDIDRTKLPTPVKTTASQKFPVADDPALNALCRDNPMINLGNNRWCIFNEAKINASASAQRIPNEHINRARNVFWRAKTRGPQRFVIRGGEIKLRLYGSEGVGDLRPRGKLIATTDDHQQVYELERFKRHNARY